MLPRTVKETDIFKLFVSHFEIGADWCLRLFAEIMKHPLRHYIGEPKIELIGSKSAILDKFCAECTNLYIWPQKVHQQAYVSQIKIFWGTSACWCTFGGRYVQICTFSNELANLDFQSALSSVPRDDTTKTCNSVQWTRCHVRCRCEKFAIFSSQSLQLRSFSKLIWCLRAGLGIDLKRTPQPRQNIIHFWVKMCEFYLSAETWHLHFVSRNPQFLLLISFFSLCFIGSNLNRVFFSGSCITTYFPPSGEDMYKFVHLMFENELIYMQVDARVKKVCPFTWGPKKHRTQLVCMQFLEVGTYPCVYGLSFHNT